MWTDNGQAALNTNFTQIHRGTKTVKVQLVLYQLFLYVSDPPYQAFVVTVLHRNRISRYENQKWSAAAFVLAWRKCFRPAYVRDNVCSYAVAKITKKRLFSHQNTEKPKQLLNTFEYATSKRLTNFENLTFFPWFYIIDLKPCFYSVFLESLLRE